MGPDPIPGGQIICLDPPEHTQPAGPGVAGVHATADRRSRRAGSERSARDLLDAQVGVESFDYVQDFGAIVPPTVISSMLGVPESDQEELRHVVDSVFHIEEGVGMINDDVAERHRQDRRVPGRSDRRPAQAPTRRHAHGARHRRGHRRRTATCGASPSHQAADFGKMLFIAGTETVARLLGWARLGARRPIPTSGPSWRPIRR